jgi:hypothetical protein
MIPELFIKMVIDAWNIKIGRTDKILAQLSDEQLQKEIAPGKNRGVYLLGHLAAINNRMLPLLELGSDPNPDLYKTFVEKADKEVTEFPAVNNLRLAWTNINAILAEKFAAMRPEDWFQKHTSVSAEDFAKEPHRNKLNVIINRTNHLDYHLGQLVLLT